MKITGTFVNPLPSDIPSLNWEEKEWDREFALMKKVGIDTVIILRTAVKKWLLYPSEYLQKNFGCYKPSYDFLEMYLRLSEKYEMKLFVGTYNTLHDWLSAAYNVDEEFAIIRNQVDEIWKKYGSSPAFGGWYMTHEISRRESFKVVELFQKAGPYCKTISGGLPVMMSPGMQGPKGSIRRYPKECQKRMSVTFDEHYSDWDWIMGKLSGSIDIIAFQDGHVEFDDLERFLSINVELAKKHKIECWTNTETFDRDIGNNIFPPITWEKLLFKLRAAEHTEHTKAITYEFAPFMSPNGCYPQAKYLLERYCNYYGINF